MRCDNRVQKVLSNEESTPITFEFYSHGACGTDNATTSYSRHVCLVHEVLIQRHALFPVAESFKERPTTIRSSVNIRFPPTIIAEFGYARVRIRECE